MVLHEYMVDVAGLRNSKYTCYQGACGACVVAANFIDPLTNKQKTIAFNSVSYVPNLEMSGKKVFIHDSVDCTVSTQSTISDIHSMQRFLIQPAKQIFYSIDISDFKSCYVFSSIKSFRFQLFFYIKGTSEKGTLLIIIHKIH